MAAKDLAQLTLLEDSPQGPQQGIDLRPRSRKSTLGSATAVEIQQGIAAGAADEPQEEPSEAEDTEVIDKVDTVREGSRPGLGDNRPGKQGDVQKSPMREPSHTPVKRRRPSVHQELGNQSTRFTSLSRTLTRTRKSTSCGGLVQESPAVELLEFPVRNKPMASHQALHGNQQSSWL